MRESGAKEGCVRGELQDILRGGRRLLEVSAILTGRCRG